MTRGVAYYESKEEIQCEMIDKQIQELRNLQNSIIPGYNRAADLPEPHYDYMAPLSQQAKLSRTYDLLSKICFGIGAFIVFVAIVEFFRS